MEAGYSYYDFNKSIERIDSMLATPSGNYEDHKGIPARSRLTFENGFYVDVTVLFVDIRGSKELSGKHTKPVLAKIYRSYISEVVAVLKGNSSISEIYIEGDGVWAVFNTVTKVDVDSVFCTGYCISSLVDILNVKLEKKGYQQISVGIGISDAESLYIKAGYSGSGISEVVWIGKVVGEAAKLCSFGNRTCSDKEIMISSVVYSSLTDHNKALLVWSSERECYHGNVVNITMNEWVSKNKLMA